MQGKAIGYSFQSVLDSHLQLGTGKKKTQKADKKDASFNQRSHLRIEKGEKSS